MTAKKCTKTQNVRAGRPEPLLLQIRSVFMALSLPSTSRVVLSSTNINNQLKMVRLVSFCVYIGNRVNQSAVCDLQAVMF